MKSLEKLLKSIPVPVLAAQHLSKVEISGIVLDSRQVQPGYLFVALSGGNTDGHRYIPAAVERGAAAVVGSRSISEMPSELPYVQVENARYALAFLSAAFYDFPARSMTMIGVTGTDGKTTTSSIIYSILRSAGLQAGIISTVNAVIGDEVIDTGFHVTTPEAPDVQRYLARMRDAGITHVVLEATSHGLAQDRVTACEFDIGVVTNITHEHLDYHGSYEAYRAAKARLFHHLQETVEKPQGNPRLAVLNRDDASFEYLSNLINGRKLTYSVGNQADFTALNQKYTPTGLTFQVRFGEINSLNIQSRLIGEYNISNILAALTATIGGLGIQPADAAAGVEKMTPVAGRMEQIDLGQDFMAIVDFAHTPNALKRALDTARQMTSGRVIAVFGSAGLRDRLKRRMMAEVSAEMADITILTAEDPRTESLDEILEEMARAASSRGAIEGENMFRVADRGAAIRLGVKLARAGDLVMALGKGHEQSMCFGEIEYPWDDRVAMRAALAERLGLEGHSMPYLPTQDA
ncbi:UDP-N-acetylmuramoyl-L-alanyl-D-glutamate--2,6-diaminopimelate ligase [Bellilinea sp.]|jgi:UDP-N-acetylmuramoyl-L-alanyl-D-glutamate--2,6-diaminopimelate ligase|uniref:UDP-N-acetylmuramoyl-L-alanyl-D-glutamate--2, 6-diaminopimelate ligase n=1 Tax=Bellilinea sp. TaxID=2838785 RepID=UPI002ADD6991|nr:UDP-N-acetylmuramoyl-L-alanyl-D-glutamate--2,6-diaminopimelate ligase [Bellilinea sp.]